MQRVFKTQRFKEDSERHIEKIKTCEDTIIKAPCSKDTVIDELNFETTRMFMYVRILRYKNKIKKSTGRVWNKWLQIYRESKEKANEFD